MNDDPGRPGAQTDEERARAYREQVKQLHAVDIASSLMLDLVTIGYQKLGLTPETEELRDLGDARLFIDLLHATLGVVENELDEMQRRDLRSTLAQMQMSFARAVQLSGAESRPASTRADAPAAEKPETEPQAAEPETEPEAAAEAAGPAAKKPAAGKPAARKPAQKQKGPGAPAGSSPDA